MKVLMVCLGNICRSPLAQGLLQKKIDDKGLNWLVDSAGTSAYHIGDPPDPRSIQKAKEFDINISHQQARQLELEDLDRFDLIFVMDSSNYQNAKKLCRDKKHEDKIKLILNYVYPEQNLAVPDPYYDGGFSKVYELLDAATDAIITRYIAHT